MSKHRDYPQRIRKGRVQVYIRQGWRYAEERECVHCGKQFYASMGGHDQGLFCSLACVGKEARKRYSRKRVIKRCEICNSPFEIQPSKANRHRTCGKKYCVLALKRRVGIERWKQGTLGNRVQRRVARVE